jgi:hypothetical protein
MINNKKIVVVTPAGRKKYMELLIKYILKEKKIIDEYRIWVNTKNPKDIAYFKELADKYKGFITLDERFLDTPECGTNGNIHKFFDECIDPETVYIRLDDDVVWLQPNFIENIAKYRIINPEPFLVYGTIINNGTIDSLLQNLGFYLNQNSFVYDCIETIAYRDPVVCEFKHKYILDTFLKKFKNIPQLFETWVLKDYERVSINCISWLGSTFNEFEGKVGHDEEHWLSCQAPKEREQYNVVYGNAYCSHFAFHPQREHMDKTSILDDYKQLSNYLDIDLKSINFNNVQWDKLPNDVKTFIYYTLKEGNLI